MRHPWEIPAEAYVASVRDGSDDPGLFTEENGWHIGKEGGTRPNRWRGAGDDAWPASRGAAVQYVGGAWYVRVDDASERLTPQRLTDRLACAKVNPDYCHPFGLALRQTPPAPPAPPTPRYDRTPLPPELD